LKDSNNVLKDSQTIKPGANISHPAFLSPASRISSEYFYAYNDQIFSLGFPEPEFYKSGSQGAISYVLHHPRLTFFIVNEMTIW